jgi:hypothetical protein
MIYRKARTQCDEISLWLTYRKGKGKAVPSQAWCGPKGSRGFRLPDFLTFGTWRWWGQPHAQAPFTPRNVLVLIFTRGWVDPRAMVQSEGNMSMKNPVTSPGIDPGTARLVAQRLNHYATAGLDFLVHTVHITILQKIRKKIMSINHTAIISIKYTTIQ